ncbi:MAG: O-antigen ligase family protein [Actinomyces sp.]|uniref:O-antigen ligase family protein n=1 Tax=Actinomyces sp. TaxID=29317 RepID=UPI0026DB9BCF|nr:O-antigen ligase family protein [Actinomyces sp.]MDO4243411.1 O-antigen ligase family protein [Actinomyces sp.]
MSSTAETAVGLLRPAPLVTRHRAAASQAVERGPLDRCYPLRYLGLMGVCLVLMKPIMVGQDPALAPLVKLATVGVLAGLGLIHLMRRTPLSTVLVLFVLYRLSFLGPTVYNGGDLLNWGYTTLSQLGVVILIDLHADADRAARRRLLRVIADLLLAYLLINYAMIMTGTGAVAPLGDGLWDQPSYLLGIRTRVTDCIFPAVLVSLLHDSTSARRWGWRTVLAISTGVLQIVTLQVATAYVGLVVGALVYVVVLARPRAGGPLSMRGVTVLGVVISLLVVVLRVQTAFASAIHVLLGKSVNLTGRTDIWDTAFPILGRSPLLGYGINDSFGAFVPGAAGLLWQAHNQYLQIIHDGGLLALGLFLALLMAAGRRADASACSPWARAALVSVYAAMSVMAVSEIYVYNMGLFFLIPFLASRAGELLPPDDERRGRRALPVTAG